MTQSVEYFNTRYLPYLTKKTKSKNENTTVDNICEERKEERERERERERGRERESVVPKTQFKFSRVKGFVSNTVSIFFYLHAGRQVQFAPSIPFYSGERQYIKEKKRVCENKRII